jgi:hypothetical protein
MVNVISAIGLYSSGHGRVAIEDHVNHPHSLDYTGGIGPAAGECASAHPPIVLMRASITFSLVGLFWKYRVTIIGSAPNVVFSLDFLTGGSKFIRAWALT